VLCHLGRYTKDLIKTNMTWNDFNGQPTVAKGVLNVELTVRHKTIPTSFFVTNSHTAYTVLLGRDWIYANYCIPSTMHWFLIQWYEDKVEVVPAEDSCEISFADMNMWDTDEHEPISGIDFEGYDCVEA
jgi:hypothetical protein